MSNSLQDTLGMFVFLSVELSALFILISLFVNILQRNIPEEKIKSLLSSHKSRSYFLAAALGAITPFCSCSTIPMLKGLIRGKSGFGPMMVFLFASPLLNPIIVGLLMATFGLKFTFIYVFAALIVSLISGWLLQYFKFENYIRAEVKEKNSGCASSSCVSSASSKTESKKIKYADLWKETWSDFIDVLPYLLIGITIGSMIYGFMPSEWLEHYAGSNNPFAIPIAAVIGVPLYIRAEAVIPLAAALLAKGVGAGTIIALIIGSAGASLTELILLRSLFTFKLLAAFVFVIFSMAIITGYVTFFFF